MQVNPIDDGAMLANLSVGEFRLLMQECFDADRAKEAERALARKQERGTQVAVYSYGENPQNPLLTGFSRG